MATVLKNVSVMWTLIHTLVLFFLLFESRCSKKKTYLLTAVTVGPLVAVNFALFLLLGFERYGMLMMAFLSVPSCVIFWLLAKYRDGRFFFTFCMVDTMVLEILYATNILNHYLTPDSNWLMFLARLCIFPLVEWWVVKRLRPMYLDVQSQITTGWLVYAVIGVLLYLCVTLLMLFPSPITERPQYLAPLVLLFILMPMIYLNIISTLRRLQTMNRLFEQENLLKLQVSGLTARMNEFAEADDRFRVERHNFRHKLKTIASLIKTEQYDECMVLLKEYEESLDKTRIKRYCKHAILDAVLSSYIQKAQDSGIEISLGFAFPDIIPVNEAELATAIANALENAINACEKLPEEKRFIDIKVVNKPRFMIRIMNSYEGTVEFDEENIPVNREQDHGFGTRFIAAFCEKNNGFYEFTAEDEKFTLYLNF